MREVIKFGGSSLSSAEKIKGVAKFILQKTKTASELVVVVSAMGKTTDRLVELSSSLGQDQFSRAKAITLGEEISAAMLSVALNALGVKNAIFTAKDVKIHAKGHPLKAIITSIDTSTLLECIKTSVAIVTGFQGVDDSDRTLCLGRGGSDTTAVALAAALGCPCKIYTDVDGYYALDPNTFSLAKKLEQIDIFSAIESAHNGAKVLDKRCLELACKEKVPLSVLKSQTNSGTNINYTPLESYSVNTLTCKNDILFVKTTSNLYNILQLLFKNENIYPNFVNMAGSEVCFAVSSCLEKQIKGFLRGKCEAKPYSLLVLTGSGLLTAPEFYEKTQNTIKDYENEVKFVCLHPTILKMVVESSAADCIIERLRREFWL